MENLIHGLVCEPLITMVYNTIQVQRTHFSMCNDADYNAIPDEFRNQVSTKIRELYNDAQEGVVKVVTMAIQQELSTMHQRLSFDSIVAEGLIQENEYFNKRFAQVDDRISGIESRLDGLEERLDGIEDTLNLILDHIGIQHTSNPRRRKQRRQNERV